MPIQNTVVYGWTAEQPYSYGYLTQPVIRVAGELKAHRILDIGCGNGTLAASLMKAGFNVTGCDADAGGIEHARRTYPEIMFHRIGVYDDPEIIGFNSYDLVISTEVIEHLFLPRMLLRFAHTLLRPGGHIILTTPYHGYLKNLILSLLNNWDTHHTSLWDGGHIKFWSRVTLKKLLEEESFKVLRFIGVGRVPFLWKSMIMVAQKYM